MNYEFIQVIEIKYILLGITGDPRGWTNPIILK